MTILPTIHPLNNIVFPKPAVFHLSNGIPVYVFGGLQNEIIKIHLQFDSGRWQEKAPLIADAVAALFKSGTADKTSYQINNSIDALGVSMSAHAGYNTFNVEINGLTKFIEPALSILFSCLNEIIFPEDEINLFKKNALARLSVKLEKTDFVAQQSFNQLLFGSHHPYGYSTTAPIIKAVTQEELRSYYHEQIHPKQLKIFVGGNVSDTTIQLLEQYIGNWQKDIPVTAQQSFKINSDSQLKHNINKNNSVQNTVIIGKHLFNKQNDDYSKFVLLNTIFGGYFGSRLMNNIREDKGLTYGIYSMLQPYKHDGVWAIHTDTNKENIKLCLDEIYIELNRLTQEKISDAEIDMARNYMLGRYLKQTDGAFSSMGTYTSYLVEGVDIDKFSYFINSIEATNAEELLSIAQKYLTLNNLYEVVVG